MRHLKRLALNLLPAQLVPPVAVRAALVLDELELHLLPALCSKQRASLDVGANLGIYSAALVRNSRRVFAIEPHPVLAAHLRRAFPRSVSVVEAALSSVPGKAEITIPVINGKEVDTRSSLEPSANGWSCNVLEVSLMTLDSFVASDVGFIKIDVEGHELQVLQGGRGLLERSRPRLLIEIEERHRKGAVQDAARLLCEWGYCGFFLYDRTLIEIERYDTRVHQRSSRSKAANGPRLGGYVNNFIFLPREQRESVLPAILARLPLTAGWRRFAAALIV